MPKQVVSIPGHVLEIDTSIWFGFDTGYIIRRNGIDLAHRP